MSCYLVNLLDTKTNEQCTVPFFRKWNKKEKQILESGPYSFDYGRGYLFMLGMGVPEHIADKRTKKIISDDIKLGRRASRGRYRVESVITGKGRVGYSESENNICQDTR